MILFGSLLAVVYVWRAVEVLYTAAPAEGVTARDPPPAMLAPMVLLGAATLYFGLFTSVPLGASLTAAEVLLQGSFGMAEPSAATSALPLGEAH